VAAHSKNPTWLPDHQVHVALTLAHADALAEQVGNLLYDYLLPPGPLALKNVFDDELCYVTVTGIAPLPPAVSRYAADVLTQLRAAVEHAVFAEVECALGRELTPEEGRRVEMPATTTPKDFTAWLNSRKRKGLSPLRDGSDLVRRLRALQPYHRKDSDEHPLRVLAEHTNLAKHRTPTVAAVRLGRVNTWPLNDPDVFVGTESAPLEVGSVLATAPKFKVVPVDIWPKVAIQRPHTGDWIVLMKELGSLAEWVRTVAIPMLVTGDAGTQPPLPPQIDVTRGWEDPRDAIQAGSNVPASERHLIRIQARGGRDNLVETLVLHPKQPDPKILRRWVDELTDHEVVARLEMLGRAALQGPWEAADACLEMIRHAEEAHGQAE
jgi:hypothetical protein